MLQSPEYLVGLSTAGNIDPVVAPRVKCFIPRPAGPLGGHELAGVETLADRKKKPRAIVQMEWMSSRRRK